MTNAEPVEEDKGLVRQVLQVFLPDPRPDRMYVWLQSAYDETKKEPVEIVGHNAKHVSATRFFVDKSAVEDFLMLNDGPPFGVTLQFMGEDPTTAEKVPVIWTFPACRFSGVEVPEGNDVQTEVVADRAWFGLQGEELPGVPTEGVYSFVDAKRA